MLVILLPILFNLVKTIRNPTTRWDLVEYGKCLLCQIIVPFYGMKTILDPDDAELKTKFWSYKVRALFKKDEQISLHNIISAVLDKEPIKKMY